MKIEKINKSRLYSAMLTLCWLTVICCCILKIFGSRQFVIPLIECDLKPIYMISTNWLLYIVNSFLYLILLYKRKLKSKEIIACLIVYTCLFVISLNKNLLYLVMILEFISYASFAILGIKDKTYKKVIEAFTISFVFIFYEILTSFFKSVNIFNFKYNFFDSLILQLDYYILIYLTIMQNLKKGGYLYVSILNRGQWLVRKAILVFLSKSKRNQERISTNKENVQEVDSVENELGYKFFVVILSIFQIMFVGTICYFVNKVIIEYFIIIISFFILRQIFGKSYHADSVIKCTTMAMIVFLSATRLTLPVSVSIFCSILIGCLVAYLMYLIYHYMKYTTITGTTIERGMNKDSLLELCKIHELNDIETNVMIMFYCEKMKLFQIGNKLNYSDSMISKIKDKALKKLK